MSKTAARELADRLLKEGPDIRSAMELRLIVVALRYYGAPANAEETNRD
jgi:hypothetical protein